MLPKCSWMPDFLEWPPPVVVSGSSAGAVAEYLPDRRGCDTLLHSLGSIQCLMAVARNVLVTASLPLDEQDMMHPALLPQLKPSLGETACLKPGWHHSTVPWCTA